MTKLSRPTVLIFAQLFCEGCKKHTEEMTSLFREKGNFPQNINLYTVILDGREDAEFFRDDFKVNWTMGFNGKELFRSYCGEAPQTPCVLVSNPRSKSIIRFSKKSKVSEWEKETGAWNYQEDN